MAAHAQWQWLDRDGRKVFSDRPPPADIPEKSILKQPGGAKAGTVDAVSTAAAPVAAASAARPAASAPKISGKDSDLEAKKKKADEEEEAKRKADQEKVAKIKAENCERAQRSMTTLQSGVRITQTNAKGEREVMDDAGRAAETKRVQGILESDCK